jgi:hypothetical protein
MITAEVLKLILILTSHLNCVYQLVSCLRVSKYCVLIYDRSMRTMCASHLISYIITLLVFAKIRQEFLSR